jgi:hypothetical protein
VTDRPRYWRGRQVRLWAYLVTPAGLVLADRREVWRGTMSSGPDRSGAGWAFEALSLDRVLERPILRQYTGIVTART